MILYRPKRMNVKITESQCDHFVIVKAGRLGEKCQVFVYYPAIYRRKIQLSFAPHVQVTTMINLVDVYKNVGILT